MPNLLSAGVDLSVQETNIRLNELTERAMAMRPQPPRRYLGAASSATNVCVRCNIAGGARPRSLRR